MNNYDHVDKYINSKVKDDKVRLLISDFAILWNQYEKALYGGKHHIYEIENMIRMHEEITKIEKLDELYDRFLKYLKFRNISFDCFGIKEAFNIWVKFYERDKGDILEDELEYALDDKSPRGKVYLLLFIAAKVRNNMFHGTKDTRTLDEQKELFEIINELLMSVLEITYTIYQ